MSNFTFLQPEWPLLFGVATQTEEMANTDARASCFCSRRALVLSVGRVGKVLSAHTVMNSLGHDKSVPTLHTLFASLQHRAFRGEL